MEIERPQFKNQGTQPLIPLNVFNNSQVLAEGWYFLMPAQDLKPGQINTIKINQQEIVVWRSASGKVSALDAFCPHMGTHFSKGKIVGENIRCFFHHWQFDGNGECQELPAEPRLCETIKTQSYKVEEKFSSLWIFPSNSAAPPLADFIDLNSQDLEIVFDKPYVRDCHHHVTMINGIDAQHLKTVHGIDIEMGVDISESSRQIDITLTGEIGARGIGEKIAGYLLGKKYSYAMRYDHASTGFLTLLKDATWLGRHKRIPSLFMIFAYRPESLGRTFVQPIFVTQKRAGLRGFFISGFLLLLTRLAFRALQGEDGEVYENMRFNPSRLIPMDRPVSKYIQYVNKLPLSLWGGSK